MVTDGLIGSWKLEEFAHIIGEAGTPEIWTGELSGRLIYALPGIVSVAINRRSAPGLLIEHNSFYTGRFRVLDPTTIEHTVEQSSDPRRIGDRYIRTFELNGDILRLQGMGLTGKVALRWIREQM